MVDLNYKTVGIYDIANVGRGKNKEYPPGTIYIRLSATDGKVNITKCTEVLKGDVAIIEPKENIPAYYLLNILQRSFPEFMVKYVGSNINIQADNLKFLRINIHTNPETWHYYNQMLLEASRSIEEEEKIISELKRLKQSMLGKLFVQ